jgi:hypothetical protein
MLKKAFTANTFLLLLILFSSSFAQAGGDSFVERIRYTGSSPEVVRAVMLVVGIVIVIVILVYIFQVKSKERGIREFINLQFAQKSRDAKLSVAEQTLLKSITWAVAPHMFSDVFNSLVIFENAVDVEINRLIKNYGEDSKRIDQTISTIFIIRKKLGFDKVIPEKALESSRNIEFGQVITLFSAFEENFIGKTKLLNNNELYFEADFLELEDFFLQNKNQNGVIAKFTRNSDAAYSVLLSIRSINTSENIISFYHTTMLERQQARQYARISIDTPVQCRIIKRTNEKATPGAGEIMEETSLLDIGGGGLAFNAKDSLTPEDVVMLSFILQTQKFVMKGKIVAISTQEGKHKVYYKHRVVFYNARPNDVERIVKFIYEKQREKIQFG